MLSSTMRYAAMAAVAAAFIVQASPVHRPVTAAISPPGVAPPGCRGSSKGPFGIALVNIYDGSAARIKRQSQTNITSSSSSAPASVAGQVGQVGDGQVQARSHTPSVSTLAPVSQIEDGQVQAGTDPVVTTEVKTASQTSQLQAQVAIVTVTTEVKAGSQTSQLQAQVAIVTVTQTVDCDDPPVETRPAVSLIADGQGQGSVPATASSAATSPRSPDPSSSQSQHTSVGTLTTSTHASHPTSETAAPAASAADREAADTTLVACGDASTLSLTLNDGVLTDGRGRTGYVASNYQFQFDAPPQAGAIYTSGFSACDDDGSLALGGSRVFYQCRSGDFFNIYDRDWAEQCSPVEVRMLELVDC